MTPSLSLCAYTRSLQFETGRLAQLANGAVLVKHNDTAVLTTVCVDRNDADPGARRHPRSRDLPSFHVCLAALTAWALAPVRVLGPVAVALNAIIMVATLGAGGHYLPDLLAGLALSALVIGGRAVLDRRRLAQVPGRR